MEKQWRIETPRGGVHLYDYWWNGRRELSIGGPSRKAALWLAAYLRTNGFNAATGRAGYRLEQRIRGIAS